MCLKKGLTIKKKNIYNGPIKSMVIFIMDKQEILFYLKQKDKDRLLAGEMVCSSSVFRR